MGVLLEVLAGASGLFHQIAAAVILAALLTTALAARALGGLWGLNIELLFGLGTTDIVVGTVHVLVVAARRAVVLAGLVGAGLLVGFGWQLVHLLGLGRLVGLGGQLWIVHLHHSGLYYAVLFVWIFDLLQIVWF